MGLFGRFSRKGRERSGDTGPRCMECGMTGGDHTDWCPAADAEEPRVAADQTPERSGDAKVPQGPPS